MKQLSLVVALMLVSTGFAAESTPTTKVEIEHLFSYLQESGCQFFRNGRWYGAKEAVNHLNRKYQYLQEKGLVSSAEAFIERAASESSTSGKAYRVRCGSNPAVNSADWFGAELERYRQRRH
jgi:Family of unknown function (DUF5329)